MRLVLELLPQLIQRGLDNRVPAIGAGLSADRHGFVDGPHRIPAARRHPFAVRRQRHGIDLAVIALADGHAQRAQQLRLAAPAFRQRPEPRRLVVRARYYQRAGRINADAPDHRSMHPRLDAQEHIAHLRQRHLISSCLRLPCDSCFSRCCAYGDSRPRQLRDAFPRQPDVELLALAAKIGQEPRCCRARAKVPMRPRERREYRSRVAA